MVELSSDGEVIDGSSQIYPNLNGDDDGRHKRGCARGRDGSPGIISRKTWITVVANWRNLMKRKAGARFGDFTGRDRWC
jgi:hypothetical protein